MLSAPWALSRPDGRTFSSTPSIAATPDLLSLAPSVQSEKCSRMVETPRIASGSAATMPMIHIKRRNGSGRNASGWKRVHTATASVQYLLAFQSMGT